MRNILIIEIWIKLYFFCITFYWISANLLHYSSNLNKNKICLDNNSYFAEWKRIIKSLIWLLDFYIVRESDKIVYNWPRETIQYFKNITRIY